jgi:hypothetical protein
MLTQLMAKRLQIELISEADTILTLGLSAVVRGLSETE